jgi:Papain family cysteine protease
MKLGRRIEFDDKSRKYPIRALLGTPRPLRSYTWRCLKHLDQGQEGACVGFSWTHEIIARPSEQLVFSVNEARTIYKLAQKLDPWPGEDYEGTSVLAGIKAVISRYPKVYSEYRWAFGLQDVLETIAYRGPVVLGINWYDGMIDPDDKGVIKPTGPVVGGHAILAKGISVKNKVVCLHNSWGQDWGNHGDCFISFNDLDKLLKEDGEACIPTRINN